jgi:hypothetical protein
MEPFDIQVMVEGNMESLLVIPNAEENNFKIFDDITYVGTVWTEDRDNKKVWCADGMIARELLDQIGQQIDAFKSM